MKSQNFRDDDGNHPPNVARILKEIELLNACNDNTCEEKKQSGEKKDKSDAARNVREEKRATDEDATTLTASIPEEVDEKQ